jgi:hypothetical protein
MKNCNNSKMNIHIPGREQYQIQQHSDQTTLIIGLAFMCIMLFGLVVALLVSTRV